MKAPSTIAAAALGAAATYFFDPQRGRRRRAEIRDKVVGRLSHLDDAGDAVLTDTKNRMQGAFARMRRRLRTSGAPDDVLAERVRSKLGRVASHPRALHVSVEAGTVTLSGPILAEEVDRTLRAVRTVPGVRQVVHRLEPHGEPGEHAALQGGKPRAEHMDLMQEQWAPSTRFLVGSLGGVLVGAALGRRSPLSWLYGAAGGAMLLRAGTNMGLARLAGQEGPFIEYTKTLHIAAPLEEVFEHWMRFENFPRFMRNVRSVRRNSDGSWHWEVAGPLGRTLCWDAETTVEIPNEMIAWTTRPGSQLEHAGVVHFQREGEGTRVQVELSYNPPGAALGHAVASLFGADPLTEMDEDLMRLKAFFETGKPAHDAAVKEYH